MLLSDETRALKCASCGAPVNFRGGWDLAVCAYCGSTNKVTEEGLVPLTQDDPNDAYLTLPDTDVLTAAACIVALTLFLLVGGGALVISATGSGVCYPVVLSQGTVTTTATNLNTSMTGSSTIYGVPVTGPGNSGAYVIIEANQSGVLITYQIGTWGCTNPTPTPVGGSWTLGGH